MTTLFLKSLKNFATTLTVQPRPTTLSHTRAILTNLQKFGKVTAFHAPISQSHDLPEANGTREHNCHISVTFESEDSLIQAQNASPLRVEVDCDLPNPAILDPFDVRGLQLRSAPTAGRFLCHVGPLRHQNYRTEDNIDGKLMTRAVRSNEPQAKLYQDLQFAGAPLGIIEGLASSLGEDNSADGDARVPTTLQPSGQDEDTTVVRKPDVAEFLRSCDALPNASLMTIYQESIAVGVMELEGIPRKLPRRANDRVRGKARKNAELAARESRRRMKEANLPETPSLEMKIISAVIRNRFDLWS